VPDILLQHYSRS